MANGPMPLDHAHPLTGGFRTQRTLADYPGEYVNLRCLHAPTCQRVGRLRKDRLIAEFGADIGLVTLIQMLAPKDCPQNSPDPMTGGRPCGAAYGDLG